MKYDIIMQFDKDYDYFIFLRENPIWHRILSRDPKRLHDFLEEYKIKRRKRVVDKIEDFSMIVNLAKELM